MASESKDLLDGAVGSTAMKVPVRCATTANITLSGFQVIDGVTLASGDENLRVFVKNQTDTTENGLWDAQSGDWTRCQDFDGNRDVAKGTLIRINEGTVAADYVYAVTTADPITIGTSALAFERVNEIGAASISESIVGAGPKTTPVDADLVGLVDSADSNILKQLSWANIKATLLTYFSTLFTLKVSTLQNLIDSGYAGNVCVLYRSSANDGGGGQFRWDSSDLSTEVTADTESGIYVAPTSDLTGASGAYVRKYKGSVDTRWFGSVADGADDADAINGALIMGTVAEMPAGIHHTESTINIPAGKTLKGLGVGVNPNSEPTAAASVISYDGSGVAVSVNGAGFGLFNVAILDEENTASTGLLINGDGNTINGGRGEGLVIHGFSDTGAYGMRLYAANSGFIAYCEFNVRCRYCTNSIDIDTDASGAFCSTNQWEGGVLNGGTATTEYGIRARGSIANDNRFYGMSVELANLTGASISVEESAQIEFDGRLEGDSIPATTPIVYCGVGTQQSNLGGLGGAGLIVDLGQNNITFRSSKTPQPRPTTLNLFDNSPFSNVTSSAVEGWTVTGAGVTFTSAASTFIDNVATLTVSIPAGVTATLKQSLDTTIYEGKSFVMGGYVKSSVAATTSMYMKESSTTAGQQHPGDGTTLWLGHIKDTSASPSELTAGFSMDNSAGGGAMTVEITMPVIVTGFILPPPVPKILHEGKARMRGVFSENFGTPATAISLLVLERDGNDFVISGATSITRINQSSADRFPTGTQITLYADSGANLSLSDGSYLYLAGAFNAASQWDNITLKHIGAGVWVEKGRTLV